MSSRPPPTPLSTRELRDKYARKALHADSPCQTTNLLHPDGGGGVARRRSPRKKPDKEGGTGTESVETEGDATTGSSPPNQKFKESSPRYVMRLSNAIITIPDHHILKVGGVYRRLRTRAILGHAFSRLVECIGGCALKPF